MLHGKLILELGHVYPVRRQVATIQNARAHAVMTSPIPNWLPLLALATVFAVMPSLGLMPGREEIVAAM
jgi:hypothetical protein